MVQYLKNLEAKVKQYQLEIKQRDVEIIRLRGELKTLADKIGSLLTPGTQPSPVLESVTPSLFSAPKSTPKTFSREEPSQEPVQKEIDKKDISKKDIIAKDLVKKADEHIKALLAQEPDESVPTLEDILREAGEPLSSPVDEGIPAASETSEASEISETPAEDAVLTPSINFNAGQFLSAVLDGEEEADEIKCLLERLQTCESDQRRSVLLSITSVYWRMTTNMAKRMITENLSWEKRLCMRYGMLDEQLMAERMHVWEQLYLDRSRPKDTGVYYIDEWYEAIIRGEIRYSTIDEFALDGAKPDPKATGAQALAYEILTVPQMQRFCVGPRSNLVAILVQDYCMPTHDNPIVTRTWLSETMPQIAENDYKLFYRKYKGEELTVKPLFVICPGYGLLSGCWEPYSAGRKRDTGPRIPICMFPPRSSIRILLMGISDYRWEYAKADSMHYWMTEGLTGKWYAMFTRREQRKDLKEEFRDSYYHWIVNESRSIPRLDKRAREFLWHNCPFSDEVKKKLKGSALFGDLIELEEAKQRREQEELKEIERIKAEREMRKAKRLAQQQS